LRILFAFGRSLALLLVDACAQAIEKMEKDFLAGTTPLAGIMRQTTNHTIPPRSESALRSLADLFPSATPLRISISVSVARGKGHLLEESTLIEFGNSTMVFFESWLPLELIDKIHLENSDRSLRTDAVVVAIRDGVSHRAIAARFVAEVRNWIIQG
jgi:hypothetical protein